MATDEEYVILFVFVFIDAWWQRLGALLGA
jgi:hypothetical protein